MGISSVQRSAIFQGHLGWAKCRDPNSSINKMVIYACIVAEVFDGQQIFQHARSGIYGIRRWTRLSSYPRVSSTLNVTIAKGAQLLCDDADQRSTCRR